MNMDPGLRGLFDSALAELQRGPTARMQAGAPPAAVAAMQQKGYNVSQPPGGPVNQPGPLMGQMNQPGPLMQGMMGGGAPTPPIPQPRPYQDMTGIPTMRIGTEQFGPPAPPPMAPPIPMPRPQNIDIGAALGLNPGGPAPAPAAPPQMMNPMMASGQASPLQQAILQILMSQG